MPDIAKVLPLTERVEVLEEQIGRQQFLLEALATRIESLEKCIALAKQQEQQNNGRSTAGADRPATIRRTEGCE